MTLSAANLLYRRPELYDELSTPDVDTVVRLVASCSHRPPSSVLDVGCGTGNLLASLPEGFVRRVGIDVQVGMVNHARRVHPGLDLRVGDVRDFQLGQTFDVITCVGLVLAYLSTEDELRAASSSMAAHAHDGTILVLHTLTQPILDTRTVSRRTTLLGRDVDVHTSYEWAAPTLVMHRRWEFADGEVVTDVLARRVWPVALLARALQDVGFISAGEADGYRAAVFRST
jgi:SAM-dependent methyltransferase